MLDIKRGSLDDGPGVRSVIFFKGCPLRCSFCQNPEAQDPRPQLSFAERRCIRCGACADACPHDAIRRERPGRVNRDKCRRCGACAAVCPSSALRMLGTPRTPGRLAELVLRDDAYYRSSGGGVTLSGGECTLFPAYVGDLCARLKRNDVHVALQTSGEFDWERFSTHVLPYCDLIFFDVKFVSADSHRLHTGRDNARILENLARLLGQSSLPVEISVPLVPGVTSTADNLTEVVRRVERMGAAVLHFRPYNPAGIEMTRQLGRKPAALPERFMSPAEIQRALAVCAPFLSPCTGRGGREMARACSIYDSERSVTRTEPKPGRSGPWAPADKGRRPDETGRPKGTAGDSRG